MGQHTGVGVNLFANVILSGILGLWSLSAWASGSPEVPPTLYHFGQYEILMKNVRAGTVPREDWDRFIMGDATRYGQKGYRRGLYGSSHPAYASYFSDIAVSQGKSQWVMAVHLKESCRVERPFDLEALYADPRMIPYIEKARHSEFSTPERFRDLCYPYHEQLKVRISAIETITGTGNGNACEAFVNAAFIALKPRIVVDGAWEASWYIRDRDCIESVQGTAEEVIQIMTMPGYWSKRLPTGSVRESSTLENASLPVILLQALATAQNVDDPPLERLLEEIQRSDIRNPRGWGREKPRWMAEVGSTFLRQFIDCRRRGLQRESQAAFSSFLEQALGAGIDFEDAIEAAVLKPAC